MSWAYILGQTSQGYVVEHVYSIRNLTPGEEYILKLKIANAYAPRNEPVSNPAITVRPVHPLGEPTIKILDQQGWSPSAYSPQIVEHRFVATDKVARIVAQVTGDIVLQAILVTWTGNKP